MIATCGGEVVFNNQCNLCGEYMSNQSALRGSKLCENCLTQITEVNTIETSRDK